MSTNEISNGFIYDTTNSQDIKFDDNESNKIELDIFTDESVSNTYSEVTDILDKAWSDLVTDTDEHVQQEIDFKETENNKTPVFLSVEDQIEMRNSELESVNDLDTSPADLDKVKKEWETVTQNKKLSVDEIMKNKDLKKYILNEINFSSYEFNHTVDNTERQGIEEFLKFTDVSFIPENKNAFNNGELSLTDESIKKLNEDYFNGEKYSNRDKLSIENGKVPKTKDMNSEWLELDLGDGKTVSFEGKKAANHYNKFAELYNNSETYRNGVDQILSEKDTSSFTVRTERKDPEKYPESNGGRSAINNNYIVVGEDTSYGILIHETGHNVTQYRENEHHGREMDIFNSNSINELREKGIDAEDEDINCEASKNDSHGYQYIEGDFPGLMGIFSQGKEKIDEIFGEGNDAIDNAYKEFNNIYDAINKGDTEKAIDAYNKIDKHEKLSLSGKEHNLRELVAQELTALLESDTRYQAKGLSSAENKYRVLEMIQGLDKKDQEYFKDAEKILNQDEIVSEKTGLDPKTLWEEHGDKLNTLFRRMDVWNGDSGTLSKKDLHNIADNKNGKRSKDEQEAAAFIAENDTLFHSFDVGKNGDRTTKGDDKISVRDTLHWLDDTERFGEDFINENREILNHIRDKWDSWNGKDTIVSVSDIDKIAKNKDKKHSEKDVEAAKFLQDHDIFTYYLDINGSQKSIDGKIGTDFLDWFNDNVKK